MKKYDTFYMSEEEIEMMKRKRAMNKKMRFPIALFFTALACYITAEFVPVNLFQVALSDEVTFSLHTALKSIESLSLIVGGCSFCKSLHEPLTSKQAEEFEEKEDIEKKGLGGR